MKFIQTILTSLTVILVIFSGCKDSDSPVAPVVEDRTPPDIWWMAPEAGSTLSDTVRLQLRFIDEARVDSVRLVKNGALVETFNPEDSEGMLEYLWNTLSDSDGVHIWEARAWDDSGNMGQSLSLLVRVNNNEDPPPEDHTPPVIAWRFPEPGAEVSGTIALRFDALDNVGIDSLRIYRNGYSAPDLLLPGEEGAAYSLAWDTESDSDGVYSLEVRAWDDSGNLGSSLALLVRVRNSEEPRSGEDSTPPVIAWLSPMPGDTLAGAVNLRFQVIDDSALESVQVLLNGQL